MFEIFEVRVPLLLMISLDRRPEGALSPETHPHSSGRHPHSSGRHEQPSPLSPVQGVKRNRWSRRSTSSGDDRAYMLALNLSDTMLDHLNATCLLRRAVVGGRLHGRALRAAAPDRPYWCCDIYIEGFSLYLAL